MRRIIKMIPNTITCLNVLCGCIAVMFAFSGFLEGSFIMILLAAVFDFLDGFAARLLKAYSPMGKELDSLADMISFGLAPAAIVYVMGAEYIAFLIAIFSALRLAKFNIDERQTTEFIGLPTPANALFFGALGYVYFVREPWYLFQVIENEYVLIGLVVVFSLLLVSEIRMFSLKFKSFKFKDNILKFSFLAASLALIIVFKIASFPMIILLYVLISIIRHIVTPKASENS
ncbi:MAG: CDP-diacylglycerol--serine O-phosphatidyltransferase [Rikenellaceae bacterium]